MAPEPLKQRYTISGTCKHNNTGHELDAINEGCRHCDKRRLQHLFQHDNSTQAVTDLLAGNATLHKAAAQALTRDMAQQDSSINLEPFHHEWIDIIVDSVRTELTNAVNNRPNA